MIRVVGLTKSYGDLEVLRGVSFVAPPGVVTGFLGPNGAGKSTTLRILTGLTRADSGTAQVLGRPYADLGRPGRRVGVLLDSSAFHPGRTGRDTLRGAARMMQLPMTRVEECLDLTGLDERAARSRVGTYSLGMRQRLGLAHALLGEPEVLVLDEPVNGLDPAGIRWLRELLAAVAAGGGTVLLSSHLLSEVARIAHRVVVIRHGRVVAEGSPTEMAGAPRTRVSSDDAQSLAEALTHAGLAWEPVAGGGGCVVAADPRDVSRLCLGSGIVLSELSSTSVTDLEDLVVSGTGRQPTPQLHQEVLP